MLPVLLPWCRSSVDLLRKTQCWENWAMVSLWVTCASQKRKTCCNRIFPSVSITGYNANQDSIHLRISTIIFIYFLFRNYSLPHSCSMGVITTILSPFVHSFTVFTKYLHRHYLIWSTWQLRGRYYAYVTKGKNWAGKLKSHLPKVTFRECQGLNLSLHLVSLIYIPHNHRAKAKRVRAE